MAYYFIYEKACTTTLDYEFLPQLQEADEYVIYADKCEISDDFMRKHNINFKKIPRDIRKV